MAEFPALPLWTDALLADTSHLLPAEFGAYMRLLIAAWRLPECSLPNDDVILARIAGDQHNWHRHRACVMSFWRLGGDGRWHQKRLEREREYVSRRETKSRSAASARWSSRFSDKALKGNGSGDASASSKHMLGACLGDAPTPTPKEDDLFGTTSDSVSENLPSTSTKGTRKKIARAAAIEIPDWIPKDEWSDWVAMRQDTKHPLTPTAFKRAVSRLSQLVADGCEAAAVLNQSTRNGWRDLFPVRPDIAGDARKTSSMTLAEMDALLAKNNNGGRKP